MEIQILKDGAKNLSVLVKGFWLPRTGVVPFLDLDQDKIAPPREGWKGLRLDSAAWLLQEKLSLVLWWDKPRDGALFVENERQLLLPMESRNNLRFEEGIGIPSPRVAEGWGKKVYASAFNCDAAKAFMFVLDFDKQ